MADDARNVAVLIDFENLNEKESLRKVLEHARKCGNVVAKLAIGDVGANGVKAHAKLRELGILPVQQSAAVKGKNSSDFRLTIEAMSLFYNREKSVEVFVIATSDTDFLPLAQWLRAAGKHVVGAGRSDASPLWQKGVDEFVVVKEEKVVEEVEISKESAATKATSKPTAPKPKTLSKTHRAVIDKAISRAFGDGTGPVTNSEFLKVIREFDPKFSRKTHGFNSLRKLVQSVKRLHVPPEPKIGDFVIHLRKRTGKSGK